jgi:hypothetical protein
VDEHPLAKHGNFAQELEDLQHLGVPVAETPVPESNAAATMVFAALQIIWGVLILVSVALQQLFGLDILLFNGPAAVVMIFLFWMALLYFPKRWPALPEPWPLRHMSDKALRTWRGVSWFVAIAFFILFVTWMTWDREAPLLVEARESGDVGLLVKSGLAFLAVAAACVPLIRCQIAVEARQRSP